MGPRGPSACLLSGYSSAPYPISGVLVPGLRPKPNLPQSFPGVHHRLVNDSSPATVELADVVGFQPDLDLALAGLLAQAARIVTHDVLGLGQG